MHIRTDFRLNQRNKNRALIGWFIPRSVLIGRFTPRSVLIGGGIVGRRSVKVCVCFYSVDCSLCVFLRHFANLLRHLKVFLTSLLDLFGVFMLEPTTSCGDPNQVLLATDCSAVTSGILTSRMCYRACAKCM